MSRCDEIIKYIRPYYEAQLAKSSRALEKKMRESETDFSLRCLYPFMKLFHEAHELEKQEPISYLCISFLKYGFLTGSYKLRLDLYDEHYVLDESPVTEYWDVPFLFDGFERDIEALTKQIERKFVNLQTVEIDRVCLTYCDYYFAMAHDLCAELIDPITKLLHTLHPDAPCKILFGAYWGEMTQLYPRSEA